MRWTRLAAVTAVLAVVLPVGAEVHAETKPAPVLMVVGDSLSNGHEGDFTWRYRLWEHLQGTGVSFTGPRTGAYDMYDGDTDAEYRVPASTWGSRHDALWGRALWQEIGSIHDEIEAADPKPTTLLVELGTNDLEFGAGAAATLQSMKEFVAAVRATDPSLSMLIGTVPGRTPLADQPGLAAKEQDYDAQLTAYAATASTPDSTVSLVDLTRDWNPVTDTHDGVHPNETGEWLLARDFGDALATTLGIGQPYADETPPASFPLLQVATPALSIGSGAGTLAPVLTWTRSFGADGYRIYQRDVTLGDAYAPLPWAVDDDHWTVGFFATTHVYAYQVRALRSDDTPTDSSSGLSNEVFSYPPGYQVVTPPLPCNSHPVAAPTTLRVSLPALQGFPRSIRLAHATTFGQRGCDGAAHALSFSGKAGRVSVTLRLALRRGRWAGTLSVAVPHRRSWSWPVATGPSARQLAAVHRASTTSGHTTLRMAWSLLTDRRSPALATH